MGLKELFGNYRKPLIPKALEGILNEDIINKFDEEFPENLKVTIRSYGESNLSTVQGNITLEKLKEGYQLHFCESPKWGLKGKVIDVTLTLSKVEALICIARYYYLMKDLPIKIDRDLLFNIGMKIRRIHITDRLIIIYDK